MRYPRVLLALLAVFILNTTEAKTATTPPKIVVVLAHPDDETWLSGTLALFAQKTQHLHVVYVTSGASKPTWYRYLFGPDDFNPIREHEVSNALKTIGVQHPPYFLRFAHYDPGKQFLAVQEQVRHLLQRLDADIVISFGPDGVTGHFDHIVTGMAVTRAVDQSPHVRLLLNIAVSKTRAGIFNELSDGKDIKYKVAGSVADNAVAFHVDVTTFARQRTEAIAAHKSQFNMVILDTFTTFAQRAPYEEFVISRSRDAAAVTEWLTTAWMQEVGIIRSSQSFALGTGNRE